MHELKTFHQYLEKFIDLPAHEFENYIQPYVTIRNLEKKKILVKPGEIETHLNFIITGLARKYFKRDREEINVQIATEGHMIHVQESFHTQTPTEFYVETIEPTTMVSINYTDLEKIYSQGAKMERLGRLIITYTTILRDKWQIQLIKLTPRERFLFFIQRHPGLLQRVPQKYLASYLNIQPETFSRFKHLIRNKVGN